VFAEVAMRIAVFNGSPRVGGNTDLLVCEAIRPMELAGHDVVRFNLNLLNIKPCQDCGKCEETGECGIDDDMAYVDEAIRHSDRIVLASPIFFFGLAAQTKLMVDRCQPFWCEKYVLKKPIPEGPNGRKGLLILVGGMKKEIGVQSGGATALAFFRTINVQEHETVSFLGVDAKGAIKERPEAFDEVRRAVKNLINPTG
jgi:multimeric flavodoxin WrbA